jgi:Ca2+-binding EF-hand superfamily protein
MSAKLTPALLARVRLVFDEFDADKSGSISSTEIKSAMAKIVRACVTRRQHVGGCMYSLSVWVRRA